MFRFSSKSHAKLFSLCALIAAGALFSGCPSSKKVAQTESVEPEPVIERSEPVAQPQRQPEPEVRREETRAPEPLSLGNIYFDYDKFDLTTSARDMLASHASALRNRAGVSIQIEGHCDERGTVEYNLALGDKRAKAVANYLASLGVERARLSTISYGKERPADSRQNESAWSKNRRAEFRVLN